VRYLSWSRIAGKICHARENLLGKGETGMTQTRAVNRGGFGIAAVVLMLAVAVARPALADLKSAIQDRLATGVSALTGDETERNLLLLDEFYANRNYEPIWVDFGGATDRARQMAEILRTSYVDGLMPTDYASPRIDALLNASDDDSRAELEVLLGLATLHYGTDLGEGRVEPAMVDPELFVHPQKVDRLAMMESVAAVSDLKAYFATVAPQRPEYKRLKAALADYRQIEADGGWLTLPDGPTLKPGMRDPQVALLRQRLMFEGDLKAPSDDPELYDPDMEDAVKRFQYRHGLTPDGAVGPKTRAEINVPVHDRIATMVLNMERRRWMPNDLGYLYVFVNMADFELKVVKGPKTIFVTKVVVGTPFHRTPVFSADMKYLVFNPYWHVPQSIASKELLPKIKNNPGWLTAHNYTLLSDWSSSAVPISPWSVNWSRVTRKNFHFKIRQGSGDDNALGRIKFMFPNRFNVYLHDTPSKSLFDKTVRSFSHGCIRVQHPDELAAVLLGATMPGWDLDRVRAKIATNTRSTLRLDKPIPVHLTYLTAWVNKDGTVNFRDDIYGRDATLAQALARSRVRPN
jgi:murein L,D-transpeptidase YcbB/YkuD